MSYKNFRFSDIKERFGIHQTTKRLFVTPTTPVEPSDLLVSLLELSKGMPLTTEKAVSEAIILPILREIRNLNKDFIELFSGENLDAEKSKGLNGECDFIFAKAPGSVELTAPLIDVCEAKKGDIDNAKTLAQNAAQMIGARHFNQKYNLPYTNIYGACTNGYEWIFLYLENDIIYIDIDRYYLNNLPQLLGVLQRVISTFRD
jgi:hypothetical protein